MLDKNKTVLVVTGCIAPPQGVAELAVADAEARRQQYLDSLGWALHETPFTKIVYCDNSDASAPAELLAHTQATGKQLEWLHFAGDAARTAAQGKGYGEGEILAYALAHSALLADAEMLCKLTGRLTVANIGRFFRLAKPGRLYFWGNGLNSVAVDTRFYAMPKALYEAQFRDAYRAVNDRENHWLEHSFYDAYRRCGVRCAALPLYPDLRGQSGSMGVRYALPRPVLWGKAAASALGLYRPKETV